MVVPLLLEFKNVLQTSTWHTLSHEYCSKWTRHEQDMGWCLVLGVFLVMDDFIVHNTIAFF
jgi:hypothetical protein